MEYTKEQKRNFWLIVTNSVLHKLKENKPDCTYELSLKERTLTILALRMFKENFFNKSDLHPIFKILEASTKSRKKNLKKTINKKSQKNPHQGV